MFLSLRWLSGLVGALALTVMAWKTLKIPNTQAATGILYVAVIVTFLGELTSLLMAAQAGPCTKRPPRIGGRTCPRVNVGGSPSRPTAFRRRQQDL